MSTKTVMHDETMSHHPAWGTPCQSAGAANLIAGQPGAALFGITRANAKKRLLSLIGAGFG
jgi:hypothetical protein